MDEVQYRSAVVHGLKEWQNAVNGFRLPVVMEDCAEGGAAAEMEIATVGSVQLFRLSSPVHRLSRLRQEAGANSEAFYTITLTLDGISRISHRGRTEDFGPGDFAILDSAEMRLQQISERAETMILTLPQSAFRLPPAALASIAGTKVSASDPIGRHVAALLSSIASSLDTLGPGSLNFIQAVIELVTASYAATTGVVAPQRTRERLELIGRIQHHIIGHLGDPDLDPAAIAMANYVSTRKLHALFREQGTTVSTWVRDRRLEMARRDLADERLIDEPVREIATRWGFRDAAHFSTVFRRAFGLSPQQYRRGAGRGAESGVVGSA